MSPPRDRRPPGESPIEPRPGAEGAPPLHDNLHHLPADPDTEETPPTSIPGALRFNLAWHEEEDDPPVEPRGARQVAPDATTSAPAADPPPAEDPPVERAPPEPPAVAAPPEAPGPDTRAAAVAPPDAGPAVPTEASPGLPAAAAPRGAGRVGLVVGGLVVGLLLAAAVYGLWPG